MTEENWLYDYAVIVYEDTVAQRKGLDDKASSVITYLSSGTGIAILGAIAAVSDGKMSPVTALCLIPSIILAMASVYFAVLARLVRVYSGLPMIHHVVAHHQHYGNDAAAKAAFVPILDRIVTENDPGSAEKARRVRLSMELFFGSVVLLVIPFGQCVFSRL